MKIDPSSKLSTNHLLMQQELARLQSETTRLTNLRGVITQQVDAFGGTTPPVSGLQPPLANPVTAKVVGPAVQTDTGWQDLGGTMHSFIAEPAAVGDTGVMSTGYDVYMFCDRPTTSATDVPNYGLKVSNPSSQYPLFFYPLLVEGKLTWTRWPGGENSHNYGRSLNKDEVVECKLEGGTFVLYLNGIAVKTFPKAVFTAKFPEGLGSYGRMIKTSSATSYTQKTTLAGGSISPLTMIRSAFDSDGYVRFNVVYTGSPYGYLGRIKRKDGSVVYDWTPAVLLSNSVKGRAEYRLANQITEQGSPFIYEFVEADADGKPKANSLVLSNQLIRPAPILTGANVAAIKTPYRQTRTYTNMFNQGYVQDTKDYSYVNSVDHPDKVDSNGMPLIAGLRYQVQPPEKDGAFELEFTITSGVLPTIGLWATQGKFTFEPMVKVDSKTVRIKGTVTGLNSTSPMLGFTINALDTTNPPKGMFLCEVGDDKTQRFCKSFRDFLRKLKGPVRCMDNFEINNAYLMDDVTWAKRSRVSVIGALKYGLPLEDYVEICAISGRPAWFNVHLGFIYTEGGRDYLRRALDLVFNGVGSDTAARLPTGRKHIIEDGNENWNYLLSGAKNPWLYLARRSREFGRSNWADGATGAVIGQVSAAERIFHFGETMKIVGEMIPNLSERVIRVFGCQFTSSDLPDCTKRPEWPVAFSYMDGVCDAPYLGGDPNAGAGSTGLVNYTPAEFAQHFRDGLPKMIGIIDDKLKFAASLSLSWHKYEFNLSLPSVSGRTKEQERAFKASQECYDLVVNEVLPVYMASGGYQCIYSDVGGPSDGESWYFYEGPNSWMGNRQWDALVDYMQLHPEN